MAVPGKDKKSMALEDYLRSESRVKARQLGADDVFVNYKVKKKIGRFTPELNPQASTQHI